MQDFSMFDLIIIAITLILGLKGLFRGFIKEVFGIIGIVGAIFIASRISTETGELIAPLFVLENSATIKLIGFIVAMIAIWLIVYAAGIVVSKIFSLSGLGVVDRILGFAFGALKIFLIFSVIAYALFQVESFKKVINEKFENSSVMPHLLSVGGFIIKLDTSALTSKLDKIGDDLKDSNIIQDGINEIKQNTENLTNEIKDSANDIVNQAIEDKKDEIISDLKNSIESDKTQENNANSENRTEENE